MQSIISAASFCCVLVSPRCCPWCWFVDFFIFFAFPPFSPCSLLSACLGSTTGPKLYSSKVGWGVQNTGLYNDYSLTSIMQYLLLDLCNSCDPGLCRASGPPVAVVQQCNGIKLYNSVAWLSAFPAVVELETGKKKYFWFRVVTLFFFFS